MPLIIQVPRNEEFISKEGGYRTHLNMLDRRETAVQRQLRRGGSGSYEPEFQVALLALCEICEGRLTLFDVGAHIGFYSALVSTIFSHRDVCVVAFEPTPATCDISRRVREVNGLTFSVVKAAVSDKIGTAELHISDKAETSNSLNPGFRGGSEYVTVPLTTLDHFNDGTFPPPKIIKIDVETLEANVIRGALRTIQRYRPIITVEILDNAARDQVGKMLLSLEEIGYVFCRVEKDIFRWRELTAGEATDRISRSNRDWICTPRSLDDGFFKAMERWLAALDQCDQSTNILVKGGTAPPENCLGFYQ